MTVAVRKTNNKTASKKRGKPAPEPVPAPEPEPAAFADDKQRTAERVLRELAQRRPDELEGVSVLDSLSPEQRAVVESSSWAKQFIQKEDFKGVAAVMIAARQLYAIAYTELKRLMDGERQKAAEQSKEVHHLTEDVLVQSAMYSASKPFSEHQFMQSLTGTVLPALAQIVDRHSEADDEAAAEERQATEKSRRERPIPFPFQVDVAEADTVESANLIDRGASLSFIGNLYACRLIARQVIDHVTAANLYRVLWLDDEMDGGPTPDANVTRVPRRLWQGCSNTGDSFEKLLMDVYLKAKPRGPIDVVVCSNLAAAYTKGFKGRPYLADAGDGHHRILKWCKSSGAALVGFVPTVTAEIDDDPPIADTALEQLRAFSRLRQIRARKSTDDDNPNVRLLVGNAGHEVVTSMAELQSFSSIVT